jgi:4-coumarate--CoA ligase
MTHPLVSDCAVVGEYSEEITSWIPKGVVTLIDNKRDYDEIKQEILELIKSQLPDYMQLRAGLYIVRALPRTSTGKIERFKFKNNLAEWLY